MRRAKTSITKATYTKPPRHVATYLKSETQSWPRRREMTVDEVARPIGLLRRLGRRRPGSFPHRPDQAHLSHQSPDTAPGDAQAFAPHLLPHLPRPIDLVVSPDPLDDRPKDLIAQCAQRPPRWMTFRQLVAKI